MFNRFVTVFASAPTAMTVDELLIPRSLTGSDFSTYTWINDQQQDTLYRDTRRSKTHFNMKAKTRAIPSSHRDHSVSRQLAGIRTVPGCFVG